MAKRLRAVVRLREAVATSQLPQLERGQGGSPGKRRRAGKRRPESRVSEVREFYEKDGVTFVRRVTPKVAKSSRKASGKRARESVPFTVSLHEAEVRRDGAAYECTIIAEGPGNTKDRNAYTKEALRRAVERGLVEGLQCYANHPTATEERERPERDVRQLVGHFREARYVEDGGRGQIRAKFIPIKGPGYEWVTSLIESALNAPADRPLIGISIDGEGHAPDTVEIAGRKYAAVREIVHLGSADIVTRAAAGGQFHRRLSESLAGARTATTNRRSLSAKQMQKRVRKALRELETGLARENDRKVRRAFVTLHEAAGATVKTPVPRQTDGSVDSRKLKARVRESDKRRKRIESKLSRLERERLADRLLSEAGVADQTREAWFHDLVAKRGEKAMREALARRQAERREQLAELRESMGLSRIEGAPARQPARLVALPSPHGGLLAKIGIDRDDLEIGG